MQAIKNRKATFEYEIIKVIEVGLVLLGTEVRPIKDGKASISEAFCFIQDNELFIKGMHVANSDNVHQNNLHDPLRNRKLLLHKKQLNDFSKELQVKGNTIIPLKLYSNEKGKLKMEIALVRGKKLYDKKNAIKERDIDKDTQRIIKNT